MTTWTLLLLLLVLLFSLDITTVIASLGDHSYIYHRCMHGCDLRNCVGIPDEVYNSGRAFYFRWLHWTCFEECGYSCMWQTVDAFRKDGTPVPQFRGKWPFIRILGIQEPASVVFSILNALPHIIMMIKFRREVPSKAPMYYVWHAYAAVGVNAWLWSTIFHARDFPFTEMMDYFGAISLVIFSIFVLCARVVGTRPWWRLACCAAMLLVFFIYHVHYLAFVKFDYGYNMKAMITAGVLNSIGWLLWCARVRKQQRYVWKMATCILCLNFLLLLEVFDFPPIWWTFDAHALWHAGTFPVCYLWYSFAIDDNLYQTLEQEDEERQLPEDVKKSL